MVARLEHVVRGACWLCTDIVSHKPVYIHIRYKHKEGDNVSYYLTPLGELWEVKREELSQND